MVDGIFPHPLVVVGRADRELVARLERWHAHRRLAAVGEAVEADPPGVDLREALEEVDDPPVLGDDRAEEREAEGISLPLECAEAVVAAVGILGSEGDVAPPRQFGGKGLVDRKRWPLGGDDIHRHPFEAMLADDRGALLAGGNPLRHQEDAAGDHVWEDVDRHLPAGEGRVVEDLPRVGGEGEELIGDDANEVAADPLAMGIDRDGRLGGILGLGGSDHVVPILGPDGGRALEQALRVPRELLHLASHPVAGRLGDGVGIEGSIGLGERAGASVDAERAEEWPHGLRSAGGLGGLRVPGPFETLVGVDELRVGAGRGELILEVGRRNLPDRSRRGAAAATVTGLGGAGELRHVGRFEDERPREHQRRHLGIGSGGEEPPHVAVDRLLPRGLARAEGAADERGIDPLVARRSQQRDPPPFPDAADADRRHGGVGRAGASLDPVDRCEHLLDLVAEWVAAEFEGGAVDVFAVGLICEPHRRVAGKLVVAIEDRGDEDSASGRHERPRQPARLPGLAPFAAEPREGLGGPGSVADGDHPGPRVAERREEDDPLGRDIVEGLKRHPQHRPILCGGDLDRGPGRPPEEHLAPRDAFVDDTEDRAELLPSAGTECVTACGSGDPFGPFLPPDRLGFVGLSQQEAVDPLDHHRVEGALNRERRGAGERLVVGHHRRKLV